MLTIKTGVLLLAHGSRREEANDEIRSLARLIQDREPGQIYEVAYLSFGIPDISDGIKSLVRQGIETIIVMPIFLTTGNHITSDIPEEIERQKGNYPSVKFIMARHLAGHPAIADVILERVAACLPDKRE